MALPRKVLVAVDAATASEYALDTASELCTATGAELHLVHVKAIWPSIRAPRGRVMTTEQRAVAEEEGESLLGRMRKRVEDRGGAVADTHLRFDERIERGLLRAQQELGADLLVIPGRRTGPLSQRLAGGGSPVAPAALVRRARGSVFIVHEPTEPSDAPGEDAVPPGDV